MNTLFLCGREVSYPLNHLLIKLLGQMGSVEVVDPQGGGQSILKRSARVFLQAAPRLLSQKYDLVFVGFYGQLLVPLIRPLTRKPVLFHPLISTYETLAFDRQKFSANALPSRLAFFLDQLACRAADHLILDTRANATYFSRLYGIPPDKISTLLVGSDETIFFPRPTAEPPAGEIVLFQGSFLPLHGIDIIVRAAKLLMDHPNIRFRLYGSGPEKERIAEMVHDQAINNIEFCPAVPLHEMAEHIARAAICLGGHFGPSEKAARVIAGKTFQDIAMGKATIVGENAANHELLTHGVDAWFCPMNDAEALADGIATLVQNRALREKMGTAARETFLAHASLQALLPRLREIVEQVSARRGA